MLLGVLPVEAEILKRQLSLLQAVLIHRRRKVLEYGGGQGLDIGKGPRGAKYLAGT